MDRSHHYKPQIQSLRALAVTLVVGNHLELPYFHGGFIGVDIFFVISGYLITGILLNQLDSSGKLDLATFYFRRLKRLFPALLVVTITALIAAAMLLAPEEWHAKASATVYAVTWTSNLFYSIRSVDYFDTLSGEDLFLHTWSLGVEEQFYLIWPSIIFVGYAGFKVKQQGQKAFLLPVLTLITLVSLGLSLYLSYFKPQLAFYQMPSRIWQFSFGAISYVLSDRTLSPVTSSTKARVLCGYIGVIGLILSTALITPESVYPGFAAIGPTVATGLMLYSINNQAESTHPAIAHPFVVWIGDRSYSIYLWHWPVTVIFFSVLTPSLYSTQILIAALTILLSMITYRFIELPFWKGKLSTISQKTVFASALCASLCVIAIFQITRQLPAMDPQNGIAKSEEFLNPTGDIPAIYSAGCDRWYHDSELTPCVISTNSSRKTVVFIGDSIGAQWFSFFPELFPPVEWKLIIHTKSACPTVDEDYFYTRIGKTYDNCRVWRNAVIEQVSEMAPDIVLLGSSSFYKFSEEQWKSGTSRILNKLASTAKDVVLIPGTPELGLNGPACVMRHIKHFDELPRTECQSDAGISRAAEVSDYLEQGSAPFKNTHLLNLNEIVCPNKICTALTSDGHYIYRDDKHLTDSFVRSHIPAIKEAWAKIGIDE